MTPYGSLFLSFFSLLSLAAAQYGSVPFDRLDKNNSVVLVVDLQEGLYMLARDYTPTDYRNNILAHAAIAQLFDLPIVMTTSAQTGPNGPLPKEMLEMYSNAPLIQRQGEVDAWDNPDFRAAVRATGKKQVILAGITADVCVAFLSLSLRAEGYDVWANTEASGTTSTRIATDANNRMLQAGVHLVSLFAIVTDLMRDWRATPGAAEVIPWLDTYYPVYGYVARAHGAAVLNGSLIPGEAQLLS